MHGSYSVHMHEDPQHPSCYHVGYALSCAEFDHLRSINPGNCHLCATPTEPLGIDHDHALGNWAVRGLVCGKCNQRLRYVDAGTALATDAMRRYLSTAWHLGQDTRKKQARVFRRMPCPSCGLSTAVDRNGSFRRHWSRPDTSKICNADAGDQS